MNRTQLDLLPVLLPVLEPAGNQEVGDLTVRENLWSSSLGKLWQIFRAALSRNPLFRRRGAMVLMFSSSRCQMAYSDIGGLNLTWVFRAMNRSSCVCF